MNRIRCKYCGKFLKEKESLIDYEGYACGECAIKQIVKIHGVSEDRAYHHLELIQFGNGHRW